MGSRAGQTGPVHTFHSAWWGPFHWYWIWQNHRNNVFYTWNIYCPTITVVSRGGGVTFLPNAWILSPYCCQVVKGILANKANPIVHPAILLKYAIVMSLMLSVPKYWSSSYGDIEEWWLRSLQYSRSNHCAHPVSSLSDKDFEYHSTWS